MTNKQFIDTIAPLAQANWAKYKILPSLTIAQACLESNYGKSATMAKYHAYFGIKATTAFVNAGGKCFSMKTKEEYTVGTLTTITDKFRAYDSDAAGVADHGAFLSGLSRYKNLVGNTDFYDCAQKIREDGYATASAYTVSLRAVYKSNNLGQYDNVCSGAPVTSTEPQAASSILKRGSSGSAVTALQQRLQALNLPVGAADGKYGAKTENAVKQAQSAAGITQDGIAGPKTGAALAAAYTVSVTAHALNVRSGPALTYGRKFVINNGDKIGVFREQNGFGCTVLGWIALNYTAKA